METTKQVVEERKTTTTSTKPPRSSSTLTCGYLIAIVQEGERFRAFGSSADRGHCDEILEISGKPIGADIDHGEIVCHIQECIRQKNISLRVRRNVNHSRSTGENRLQLVLLDVFVIGSNAHEQLNRFFRITNIFNSQQGLLKLTGKMEMLELANANPNNVDKNGSFEMATGNHQQPFVHQSPINQMGVGPAHMFGSHQQQQHQGRLIGNQRISKPRELPVDVPDSFVGIAKQSPRYPPPKPHRQISPPVSGNNLTTFSSHSSSNQSFNPNSCTQQQLPAAPPIAQTTAANIVNHNASLRSSIKLKQLEKSRGQQNGNYPASQMQPAVNQAFEMNEDELMQVPNQQPTSYRQSADAIKQQNMLKMKQTMPDLCSIYNRLQRNLNGDFTDATGDAKLLKLLSIYNTIVQTHDKQFRIPNLTSKYIQRLNAQGVQEPETYKVSDLLQSVILMLRDEDMTSDTVELLDILGKHEIEGVCSAFDRVSKSFEFAKGVSRSSSSPVSEDDGLQQEHYPSGQQQQHDQNMYPYPPNQMNDYDYTQDQIQMDIENNLYQNSLHPLTDVDLSDGTCTKTVRFEKNASQHLGATIKNDEHGGVIIGRIICGGAAYNSGLLNEGDELLDVNGINLRGKKIDDVITILKGLEDSLTFTVISKTYKSTQRPLHEKTFVKTFFKYDGLEDPSNPCKELALSFDRGEILAIIDRSDENLWQARREADSEWHLAGLIPSITLLKRRENQSNHEEPAMYSKREKKNLVSLLFNCPKGSAPRRRKKLSNVGPQEIPYYEEVTLYYPNKYQKRPIILVGPKMIGQDKIKKKLLEDPSRFASAVSHTSKPRGPDEIDGVNFHFVSRAEFEADMNAGKFIECGQFQNHYYGTSIEAMKQVVASQKFCVHSLNMPSIFHFRQGRAGSQLKPFFVFVKPDTSHPDKLRNLVASISKSNMDESNIKAIMSDVELIETYYLPYFDFVLTVSDVDSAYKDLVTQIGRIEEEPQWIPGFWEEHGNDNN
uniref:MAGUK p55 subfamily member 5 n=2 Tax=Aceria tosichella TaxID=561515 RepID=A0A6G1S6N2_9ACAR